MVDATDRKRNFAPSAVIYNIQITTMANDNDTREIIAPHNAHDGNILEVENMVHGKEKWWNWRVLMNRKAIGTLGSVGALTLLL